MFHDLAIGEHEHPVFMRWYELGGAFDLVEAGDYALAAGTGGIGDLDYDLAQVTGEI